MVSQLIARGALQGAIALTCYLMLFGFSAFPVVGICKVTFSTDVTFD